MIIETQMYAVSTTEKLRAAVQVRINNLREIGELEKNVFVIVIIYEYAGTLYFSSGSQFHS